MQEARGPWAQLAEDASHSDVAHWRRPRGRKLFDAAAEWTCTYTYIFNIDQREGQHRSAC